MQLKAFGFAVIVAGLVHAGAANARDLNAYNPYSGREGGHTLWDSYYGGFNVGFGFDTDGARLTPTVGGFPASVPGIDNNGGVVGGQVGVNTRFSDWVYGVEFDFDYSSLGGNKSVARPAGGSLNIDRSTNYLATLRGRVGLLVSPATLVYGTGGFAFGETELSISYTGATTGQKSDSRFATGFAAGGGLEHAFNNHMSYKFEYLYVDLNKQTVGTPQLNVTSRNTSNLLRTGINVKF